MRSKQLTLVRWVPGTKKDTGSAIRPFLVARTNFGMSYMARKGRGRHRNCPKNWQVPSCVKKLTCPLGFLQTNSG